MNTMLEPPKDQGSIAAGFGIGWLCMLIGGVIAALLTGAAGMVSQFESARPLLAVVLLFIGLLPLLMPIAAMIHFGRRGRSKTVKGVLFALLSALALLVLLVAACFGLLMNANFH